MERKNGYYWTKLNNEWFISEWHNGLWDGEYDGEIWEEIDENEIVRQ